MSQRTRTITAWAVVDRLTSEVFLHWVGKCCRSAIYLNRQEAWEYCRELNSEGYDACTVPLASKVGKGRKR